MENYDENRFICLEPLHIPGRAGFDLGHRGVCAVITPACEIMTDEEFIRHAIRIDKLFQPIQPSDAEYLAVRMQDDVPGDVFVQLAMKMEEMVETAGQMLELMHVRPEGSA